jgi:hypothetical protein
LDPELDLGCLPYRERFASGAPDEVHFGDHFASPFRQGQKNKTLERYEIKKKEEEILGNQKAKKQKLPNADVGGSGGRAVGRTGRQTNSP